jgi:deoxyribose-phosphate aldolase
MVADILAQGGACVLTVQELAKMIDHSILLPGQSDKDLVEGIEIARKYNVKCVVPKAHQAARAKELLRGSDVLLCMAIGFPQGFNLPEVKRLEAELALKEGARELDLVINTSALKSGDYDFVEQEIRGVVEVATTFGAPVKAILETCILTDEEKVAGAKIAERAGAAFVKTSTATQKGGATVEDIRLLRSVLSPHVVVKASGFVTDIDKTLALYEAGARRFGTGYTVPILEGLKKRLAEQG